MAGPKSKKSILNLANGHSSGHAEPGAPAPTEKRVFTTGEAADVCKVSQQTIIRCFDSGRLGGFRVPGSKFRRIPRAELLKFMKANDIPPENLESFLGLTTKRILVVDDDPAILDLFREVLNNDPRYNVKFAATGYEAGLLTESFRPHLLILDFMLPDINGDAVCKRIRENEHLASTKVLFVSGVVSRQEIERLLTAGASGFIAKPFNLSELTGRINSMLELTKAA